MFSSLPVHSFLLTENVSHFCQCKVLRTCSQNFSLVFGPDLNPLFPQNTRLLCRNRESEWTGSVKIGTTPKAVHELFRFVQRCVASSRRLGSDLVKQKRFWSQTPRV